MPANECIPVYEGAYARKLTGHATAAITGKRFVSLSGSFQSGPGLAATAEGGNLQVGVPTLGSDAWGVSGHDIPSGGKGVIYGGAGVILPLTSSAAIALGANISTDAAGKAKTTASGEKVLGKAMSAVGGADLDVYVELAKGGVLA